MDRRSSGRIKKYGVCLNDKCEQYKQIQELLHGETECPSCKKKLSPCAPPKKKGTKKPLILGLAVVCVLAAGVAAFTLFSGSSKEDAKQMADTLAIAIADSATQKPAPPEPAAKPDTVVVRDTLVVRDTIVQNNTVTTSEKVSVRTVERTTAPAQPKASSSSSGSLRLSYGRYTGATKGGYPHGQGRLTYSTTRVINKNDMKGRTANAGDYVIGEFFNGFVVYGKHYDSAGNLLESLNFGVGSESSYDSK